MDYTVNIKWDEDAKIWFAISDDIPGLMLEDSSYSNLKERIKNAVLELLEANHLPEMTGLNYTEDMITSPCQFKSRLRGVTDLEEIKRIGSMVPKVSEEKRKRAYKILDDGIYDKNGRLIGEKHPDD